LAIILYSEVGPSQAVEEPVKRKNASNEEELRKQ
jgi:hypothetical protein